MGREAFGTLDPTGYQQLTVSTSSTALTVPAGSRVCYIVAAATNGVNWRDDGTAPTAGVGMPFAGGASSWFYGDPTKLRFIRSGGADAVLNISYYR